MSTDILSMRAQLNRMRKLAARRSHAEQTQISRVAERLHRNAATEENFFVREDIPERSPFHGVLLRKVNDDLGWGVKTWVEYDTEIYVFTVTFRGSDGKLYHAGEKITGSSKEHLAHNQIAESINRVVPLLYSEAYRAKVERMFRGL